MLWEKYSQYANENSCLRIVEEDVTTEDGSMERQTRIYHTLDNSREYHKDEPQFIIIPPEMVPTVLQLVSAYPAFTKISDLQGDVDEKNKVLSCFSVIIKVGTVIS